MKQFLKFIFPLLAFGLMSTQAFSNSKEPLPETLEGTTKITAEELIELFDKFDNLVLIDSRIPADKSAGYIEGAIALPNTETTVEALAKHIPSKTTPVAFYCNGPKCGRSYKAAKIAIKAGYKNIYWFRGGWEEWAEKGYPAVKD